MAVLNVEINGTSQGLESTITSIIGNLGKLDKAVVALTAGINSSLAKINLQPVQQQATSAARTFNLLSNVPFTFGAQIQRAASIAVPSLQRTTTAAVTAERTFTLLDRHRFTFGANFTAAAAQVQRSTPAITAVNAVVNRSRADFTNWGRVIQDLPFGFIGIQNNLTQLIPSIGAFGLGFSVLVSAITFAQVGLSNWTRGLEGNKKAVDAASGATKEYADT